MDFTISKYKEILSALIDNGNNFYTVKNWIENNFINGVVIRHDVDRKAVNSLKTAHLENKLNINATYYFRIFRNSFKEEIIKEIAEMGHEIGYHYEELTTNKGDYEKSIIDFEQNLKKIRKFYDVKTIAMHGKPTSKIDNRNLWTKFDFRNFGIIGDVYLSINYSDCYYFSDTGRSWKSRNAKNYKDYVNSLETNGIESSDDLIEFIKNEKPKKLFLMTHPERWNDNFYDYTKYYLREFFIGNVKRIYFYFR